MDGRRAVGVGEQVDRLRTHFERVGDGRLEQIFAGLEPARSGADGHLGQLEHAVRLLAERAGADHAEALGLDEEDCSSRVDNMLFRMLDRFAVGGLHREHGRDPLGVDLVKGAGEAVVIGTDGEAARPKRGDAGVQRPESERRLDRLDLGEEGA